VCAAWLWLAKSRREGRRKMPYSAVLSVCLSVCHFFPPICCLSLSVRAHSLTHTDRSPALHSLVGVNKVQTDTYGEEQRRPTHEAHDRGEGKSSAARVAVSVAGWLASMHPLSYYYHQRRPASSSL